MHSQHLDEIVMRTLGLAPEGEPDMQAWMDFLTRLYDAEEEVTIGLVGKYVELQDAYSISVELASASPSTFRANSITMHCMPRQMPNVGTSCSRHHFRCVGENPDTHLVEVVELPDHRWYIGTQYHPEYSSTVLSPNPIHRA